MKKILLSQRLVTDASTGETREALDSKWGGFLDRCGLLAVPGSVRVPPATLMREIAPAGVLLTGGNDLSALNPSDPLCELRDEFESALIRLAVETKIPVLGVCRGAQMLAHYFGSELSKKEGHVSVRHKVRFTSGGIFVSAFGESADVNSFHRFSIVRPGPDLTPEGLAEKDGTVEAFSHRGLTAAGMMWHPEREEPFSGADISFFKHFFEA